MRHDALQKELDKIENEARQKTQRLLAAQEVFGRAVGLVWLLKTYGAPETLRVCVHYHHDPARMVIYEAFAGSCHDTMTASRAAGIIVERVEPGHEEDVARLVLRGNEDVCFYVSRYALDQERAA